MGLALLIPAYAYAQPSEGRRAAQRARGLALGGQCDLAIPSFDQAIQANPSQPDLVRDRGACHERLGHRALAAQDYRAYCDAAPTATDVPALRQRIAQLEAPVAAPPPTPPSVTSPEVPPPSPDTPDSEAPPTSANPAPRSEHAHGSESETEPFVLHGLELGLRTGYALPLGLTSGGGTNGSRDLNLLFTGVVPLWFDAGYRVNAHFYIGAFFQFGIGIINSSSNGLGADCKTPGVSCSANDLMFGVDAAYHVLPSKLIDPWIGVGVGYESVHFNASAGGQSGGSSFSGFQFANLQVGGDFKVLPNLGLGPFLMFSLGEYASCSTSGVGSSACTIPQTALHEWLTFGIRGAYDIEL